MCLSAPGSPSSPVSGHHCASLVEGDEAPQPRLYQSRLAIPCGQHQQHIQKHTNLEFGARFRFRFEPERVESCLSISLASIQCQTGRRVVRLVFGPRTAARRMCAVLYCTIQYNTSQRPLCFRSLEARVALGVVVLTAVIHLGWLQEGSESAPQLARQGQSLRVCPGTWRLRILRVAAVPHSLCDAMPPLHEWRLRSVMPPVHNPGPPRVGAQTRLPSFPLFFRWHRFPTAI